MCVNSAIDQYRKINSIKKLHHTCENIHSDGEIVKKPKGQLNCLTPSIKYKCSQCQYLAENSLKSNACLGVHLYFFTDSTAPKKKGTIY